MKNKFIKAIALIGATAVCTAAFAGCSRVSTASTAASDNSSKPLSGKSYKIALNATFAPFESLSVDSKGNTEYVGFDIDLLKAMAKDLGFSYTIDNMDFNGLVGALQSSRDDFVISGISPTAERKKTVDFTDSYFTCKTAVIEKKGGKITDVAGLKGKKIAASFGTDYETFAKSAGAVVSSMDSSTLVMQELLSGRVEGAILDASQAAVQVKQNSGLEYHVLSSAELNGGVSDTFAIACPKGSPLVTTFNTELKKLQDNGTVSKLITKWMGSEYLKSN